MLFLQYWQQRLQIDFHSQYANQNEARDEYISYYICKVLHCYVTVPLSPSKGIICLFYVKNGIAVGRYSPAGKHTVLKTIHRYCDGFYTLPQQYQGTSVYVAADDGMMGNTLCHIDVRTGVLTVLGSVPEIEDNFAVYGDKLLFFEDDALWTLNRTEACYRYIGSFHRINASFCVCEGKVYAFGGQDLMTSLSEAVDCYDPRTDSWTSLHRMVRPFMQQGCVAIQHLIYVVGGRTSHYQYRAVNTLWCYDTHSDTWTELRAMPTPRFAPAVCVYEGRIYVMGGINGTTKKWLNVVESYDIQSNMWLSHAAMPWKLCRAWFGVE